MVCIGALQVALEPAGTAVEVQIQMGTPEDRVAAQMPGEGTQFATVDGGDLAGPTVPHRAGDVVEDESMRSAGEERRGHAGGHEPVEQTGGERQQDDNQADPTEPLQTITSPAT